MNIFKPEEYKDGLVLLIKCSTNLFNDLIKIVYDYIDTKYTTVAYLTEDADDNDVLKIVNYSESNKNTIVETIIPIKYANRLAICKDKYGEVLVIVVHMNYPEDNEASEVAYYKFSTMSWHKIESISPGYYGSFFGVESKIYIKDMTAIIVSCNLADDKPYWIGHRFPKEIKEVKESRDFLSMPIYHRPIICDNLLYYCYYYNQKSKLFIWNPLNNNISSTAELNKNLTSGLVAADQILKRIYAIDHENKYDCYYYDLKSNQWMNIKSFSSFTGSFVYCDLICLREKLIFFGKISHDSDDLYVVEYDPSTGDWTDKPHFLNELFDKTLVIF